MVRILLLLVLVVSFDVFGQDRYTVEVARNIRYSDESSRHLLDVYRPADVENYPVLMFVSGGGWTSGSKDWIRNIGATFATHGIGVVTVDHRLAPNVDYSEMVADLALSLAWIKDNAEDLGANPAQVFIGGHSAGAHLVALLATDPSYLEAVDLTTEDVLGVVAVSGIYEMTQPGRVGFPSDELEQASPIAHVGEHVPPFLLLYAEDDLGGVVEQAEQLANLLDDAEIEMMVERDHFDIVQRIGTRNDMTTDVILAWLQTRLDEEAQDNEDMGSN